MKILVLIAVVLSQGCLGSLYAWSAYVPSLQVGYGFTATQTQLIFGGLVLGNTLLMVYAGRLLKKTGPRALVVLSALLFAGGYLLAGFSGGSFGLIFLGIAVLFGLSIGFGYVSLLKVCMEWFPEREGLASGFAVAGFGGGAIAVSALVERFLAAGYDVLNIFKVIGAAGGLIILISSPLMRLPDNREEEEEERGRPIIEVLVDRTVWLLFFAMFAGTFTGLVVAGNLTPIALEGGLSDKLAVYAVGVFSIGNAGGRLVWGWGADLFGAKTIPASLGLLALGVLGVLLFSSPPFFYLSVILVGLCFGASFVIYVTYIAEIYGASGVGDVYPLVFIAQGISGVFGPALAGLSSDITGSFVPALALALLVATAASTVTLYVFFRE